MARELEPQPEGARQLAEILSRGPGAPSPGRKSLRAVARTVRALDNRTAGEGTQQARRTRAARGGSAAAGLLRLDAPQGLNDPGGGDAAARPSDSPRLSRDDAQTLVTGLNGVLREWMEAREAIRHREAELATALPITPQSDETQQLVARLRELLRSAVMAARATSAAVYLLDDATSSLKLRASHELPLDRFYAAPRRLREQLADLEALLGRRVIINDTRAANSWKPPEACRSAMCLPIMSPSMPLGTLWIFGDQPQEFSPTQADTIEILAARLASELEREALLRETSQVREYRTHWRAGVRWQRSRQPRVEPLAEGWDIAGWSPQSDRLSGQFVDWEMTPQGTLAITMARSDGRGAEAALSAASLHGILKARLLSARDPRQLLNTINDTAWRSSAGDGLGSLAHAAILPEKGTLQFAGAGDISALWVRPDSLVDLPIESAKLGQSPEVAFTLSRQTLAEGDMLVLCGARLLDDAIPSTLPPGAEQMDLMQLAAQLARTAEATQREQQAIPGPKFPLSKQHLAEICRSYRQPPLEGLVEGLRRAIADSVNLDVEPPAFAIISRRPPVR